MSTSIRAYGVPDDYDLVDRFLVELYEPDDRLDYWLQPRWEYMHSRPEVENVDLESIGIAVDDDGTVVGVVHPEHAPASWYLEVRRDQGDVKAKLIDWAESHPGGWSRSLEREVLGFFIDDADTGSLTILADRGYTTHPTGGESHARMLLDEPLPSVSLPEGFRLESLADDNDLAKVDRVLWRGFDHEGPPPQDAVASRARAQETPNYRKELNIVVVADNGTFASYAGIWYVPQNEVAYVEPVATDPDYRRMGLGRAAVLETVRRARNLGATVVWVGSDQEFYLEMGFEVVAHSMFWYRDVEAVRSDRR